MSQAGLIAGILALVWAYSVAWMVVVALFVRHRRRRRALTESAAGRWLLVRPCAGLEPGLRQCLASTGSRADSLEMEVVFGVSEASDPAQPVAESVAAELRAAGIDARVMVMPPRGPNRKASTLAGAAEQLAGHAGLINVDSNIDMTGLDLAALIRPLAGAGATWMPPVEVAGTTLGDRASRAVLGGSFHAFALLAGIDPAGLVGKVFAIRRDAVGAAGFDELPSYLGEDVELSARLRAAGISVEPVWVHARACPAGGSLADTIARHSRWISVVRAQRLALLLTYPLLFAPSPGILLLGAFALGYSFCLAAVVAAAAVASRLCVSAGARYASGLRWQPLIGLADGLLADLVLWAALARGLTSREVSWRGRRLRIDAVGRLHTL
jgi:ceramide glucosyltransferase